MKQVYILESADDLIRVASTVRGPDDKTPNLRDGVLLIGKTYDNITLETPDDNFELSPGVTVGELLIALCRSAFLDLTVKIV